ncbi:Crp/Fnr family transcriptional regulator [Chitinophaga sp.]|uniref:Crp/Fnr family transcriptional regulator n=1 Tax=Chitinophaga sp. TaxID=1869181 RepID=UPI0031D9F900
MEKIEIIAARLNLPASFKDDFLSQSRIIHIPKKGNFVRAGSTCTYLGIVETGALYAHISSTGEDLITDFFVPGSFVSYYRSFLTQQPASGSISAEDDTMVRVIDYDQYRLLQQSLEWLTFFKYISDGFFIRKCTRETSFMKLSAQERYKQLINRYPKIEQQFPQYKIASYLGIKPETLSRIRSLDLHQDVRIK